MDDKFKEYYEMIDIYDIEKKGMIKFDESFSDASFFKDFSPFNLSGLMYYLKKIIYTICDKLIHKDKVQKEIQNLKNALKEHKQDDSIDYKWKNISLILLLKGDYIYLKDNFIIRSNYVPDNISFMKNFSYPNTSVVFPFSIKEIYDQFLERGISITINNYYLEKNMKNNNLNYK